MQAPDWMQGRKALLVVAHPGHELRVHGWLELARPEVWVLTDGSGHGERGRLPSTRALLAVAGASPGQIFGRLSDRDAYSLLLRRDVSGVASLVAELASRLTLERVDYVAADACEGFNPIHDLCRLVVDAALVLAAGASGRSIENFEFPLEGGPGWRGDGTELVLELDDDALARKLTAARRYAGLGDEVERALRAHGEEAFRRERFFRLEALRSAAARFEGKPLYERFGEERVAAGLYSEVLRYREHFLPLAEELVALATASLASAGGEGVTTRGAGRRST